MCDSGLGMYGGAGTQWVECWLSMCKSWVSFPQNTQTWSDGTWLSPQHCGGGNRSSRSSPGIN